MGTCENPKETDCDTGRVYMGPGLRKWTCWVSEREGKTEKDGRRVGKDVHGIEERLTGEMSATSIGMRTPASSRLMAAFTPGVTAR